MQDMLCVGIAVVIFGSAGLLVALCDALARNNQRGRE